ncbi:ATP-binding protein [Streptomyces sp. SID14478]|nr:ATP-binding protein [Streptomyces sp. SID14478]
MTEQPAACHCRAERRAPLARAFSSQEHASPADARRAATLFLEHARTVHASPVSERLKQISELAVSELVTNVAKYAPGPHLLELELTDTVLRITVWDSSTDLPRTYGADPGRLGQHGLEIVNALSQQLEIHPDRVGKRITATVPVSDSAPGPAQNRPSV